MISKAISVAFKATLLLGVSAGAQDATRVNVELDPDTGRRTYEDSIEGYASFDYIVPGEAGQELSVVFRSNNMGAYINIYPPGSETALHMGPMLGNRFEGELPETGDYRVQVFMMRNAARRGEVAEFTIELALDGDAGEAPARNPDFADGLSGGPDFWEVTGVGENDELNVRSGPSTSDSVVGQVENETVLRNLGCRMEADMRWCRVETVGDAATKLEGWVAGRYLKEGARPDERRR